jgi:hypothetical protein
MCFFHPWCSPGCSGASVHLFGVSWRIDERRPVRPGWRNDLSARHFWLFLLMEINMDYLVISYMITDNAGLVTGLI